ncbi:MAG: Na(+)-translocating NADH-quinone reductase subunit C [Planctomycetaceae bacterium]
MQRDSIQNTFRMAILLCLVCSVMVSATAVGLRSTQQAKKEEFRQQNILKAAGLWEEGADAKALFNQYITAEVLDFEEGRTTERYEPDAKELDPKLSTRDSSMSKPIDGSEETGDDIASIRVRETYTVVYEVREDGKLKTLILPIRGYGLWSTLWGFIALDFSDTTADPQSLTVKGLTYYSHAETPGLGGEVDNENWKAKWQGKRVYDEAGDVLLEVSKSAAGDYQVDALSGATLTSNGVTNMLKYWLGPHGFGPYIKSTLAGK